MSGRLILGERTSAERTCASTGRVLVERRVDVVALDLKLMQDEGLHYVPYAGLRVEWNGCDIGLFTEEWMRRWLINVAKNETILIVAAILALISCFIVPPDADYRSYIHASTISQLICLMIVVCGFQRIGVFRIIGSRLLEKVSTMRGLVITLVALTFFSAMFITNDVALVTFVPFAVAVLIMAGQEDKTILVATLMTIGANVGSMFTPIGNAHNLYLKALTGMPTMEFLGIMAPYSGTAAVLLVIVISVVFGSKPVGAYSNTWIGDCRSPSACSSSSSAI